METNTWKVILEVAKTENISRAAANLGYTQSGVSHTIKRLEEDLDLVLFTRDRKGAFLTGTGRELLPFIASLSGSQDNLLQAVENIHELSRGTITIGTYSSIARLWLPDIIRHFHGDYPSIRIQFKEGGALEIKQWLENREVDLAFLSREGAEGCDFVPLKEDPLVAVLPADYPYDKPAFALSDCEGAAFVVSERGTDIDIHRTLEQYRIHPDIRYSSMDDYTIVSMVAGGLGISILPAMILENYDAGVRSLPLDPPVTRRLGLAVKDKLLVPPAARKFIQYVNEYFRERG